MILVLTLDGSEILNNHLEWWENLTHRLLKHTSWCYFPTYKPIFCCLKKLGSVWIFPKFFFHKKSLKKLPSRWWVGFMFTQTWRNSIPEILSRLWEWWLNCSRQKSEAFNQKFVKQIPLNGDLLLEMVINMQSNTYFQNIDFHGDSFHGKFLWDRKDQNKNNNSWGGLGSDENHNFTKTTSFPRLQDEFPWDVM